MIRTGNRRRVAIFESRIMSNAANSPISFNGIEIVECKFGPSGSASLPSPHLYLLNLLFAICRRQSTVPLRLGKSVGLVGNVNFQLVA
jgi:hypothetical protein